MELQAFFNALSESAAKERSNYHLTLGGLIEALEKAPADLPVNYDFDGMSPSSPASYRGYYSDLSFPPSIKKITVSELLAKARGAVGSVFEGYKGGDFRMDSETPLWASEYGTSSGLAIVDAKNSGAVLTLVTKQIS